MKKIFTLCLLASYSIILNSCLVPDDITPDPVVFEKIADVPQILPFQTVAFGGNQYPGIIQDYKMFFGATEVSVSKITADSIYVFVPLEVQVGSADVKLVYKASEFNIGKVNIIDWNTVSPHNVSYFETKDAEHPYHITDSLSNSIIPHINGEGVMDKIYLTSFTGETSILELDNLGLPAMYYNKKESVVFEGYNFEKGTVNLARFPTNNIEDAVYQYGVPVDPVKLKAIRESKVGGRKRNGRYADSGEIFSHIGLVFDVTACLVGSTAAVIAPPTTFLTGAGLVITCASAVYSVVKLINPEQDNKLGSHLQTVHSIKMNLINCLGLVKKPKDAMELYDGMYGCYGLALEAAKGVATLYDEFKAAEARDLAKMQAILATGYGDIKITLDWNSTADIDLWVIDPRGEKIYYEYKKSLSTQGELDLDDTDGYGPENVFWPTDKAPFGTYKVQVHYYGPSSGSSTSYRVMINNFGRPKTFKGSLSYNQVVTVATFKANEVWNNNSGGRMAPPEILMADRSVLPLKK